MMNSDGISTDVRIETVDDDLLTKYPYHSVGRLYWFKLFNKIEGENK